MIRIQPGIHGYQYFAGQQLLALQLRQAQQMLDVGDREKASLATIDQVRDYAARQKQLFIDAIGGLPDAACELTPELTGTVRRTHYRVEKIIFQSRPDVYVTANLYLPEQVGGPVPAVVLACGHARQAKAYPQYQAMAGLLAQNGIVCFVVDPTGQGERFQLIDRTSGAELSQWGVREHSYMGLACTAKGRNIARYFISDLMRAIDYLETRPEVDEMMIGVMGQSGGGTQTTMMMLADDRVAAAAPSCYLTERRCYMRHLHAQDAEQNYFDTVSHGFNYDDMLIAFAPKPVLVNGVASDFFPVEGLQQTFSSAERIYKIFNRADNCRLFIDAGTHDLTRTARVEILNFFSEVFSGRDEADLDTREDDLFTEDELRCTRTGQILVDRPTLPSLMDLIARDLPPKTPADADTLTSRIRHEVIGRRERTTLSPRIVEHADDLRGYAYDIVYFESQPELAVAGVLLRPKTAAARVPATVIVGPDITRTLEDEQHSAVIDQRELLRNGGAVFFFDVRASGCVAFDVPGMARRDNYGSTYLLAEFAWLMGDNLACQRAWDIVRALDYLAARPDIDADNLGLLGMGEMALPAMLAAVADPRIKRFAERGLPKSLAGEFAKSFYNRQVLNEWSLMHGLLEYADLADLRRVLAARAVTPIPAANPA